MLLLGNQFCFAHYSTSAAMTRRYKPLLLDSGTLTALLKQLEASGLVSRLRAVEDQCRVLLRLTPAGRALKVQATRIPGCVMNATHCKVPELLALTQQMQALRQQLAG